MYNHFTVKVPNTNFKIGQKVKYAYSSFVGTVLEIDAAITIKNKGEGWIRYNSEYRYYVVGESGVPSAFWEHELEAVESEEQGVVGVDWATTPGKTVKVMSGWGFPLKARVQHYWNNSPYSLCDTWLYTGELKNKVSVADGKVCQTCLKRLIKLKNKENPSE